ncbi:MAG: nucleoside kinase [Deltaproteobacteria bacterium]|nr:nucleoside kinase [Deltaproteobacteria bacterium]
MTIRVFAFDDEHQVPRGTTAGDLLAQLGVEPQSLLAASLNQHLVGLDAVLGDGARLAPVFVHQRDARAVLRRTSALLLQAAAAQVMPSMRLVVGQTLLGGHYYEVLGADHDLGDLREQLVAAMRALIEEDATIVRSRVPVETAPKVLDDEAGTKLRLLRAWPTPFVPIVRLGGFADIQHGPIAPSLRFVRDVALDTYEPGLLLYPPGTSKPDPDRKSTALYATYREARDWNRRVGVETVGDLNSVVLDDRADEIVRVAEALHEKKIAELADAIARRRDRVRFVLVAGPSSSGKTTFVRRLSVQLRVNGITPVAIGLDDYYRDRTETPRDETGELDFEALEALDLPMIDRHIEALADGKTIEVPRFDFKIGGRAPEPGRKLQLEPNQVALVEGIHGLNPRLTEAAPEGSCFRIYINALTQLVIDDHNRIFTADGRLLRRIVRDRRYRNTRADETIARWPSVRRGEERHIFRWDEEADATFNSTLFYETAVLKIFAWRYLLEVPHNHPSRSEAHRLLRFLELFVPLFPDAVPATSVLREFIGGSGFEY